MVHRQKSSTPPSKLTDPKWDQLKTDLLTERDKHDVDTKCYRDSTIDELSSLYDDKCAICERYRGTELQVDHYRPKKPRNNKTDKKYNQPGYYWLAYTWSNLIPLCSKCNGNKSNKFPLMIWSEMYRISDHQNLNGLNPFDPYELNWLQDYEKPFLINPEFEKTPERHFSFSKDCKMKGRTKEGEVTIEICKLNRKDLIRERLAVRQEYVQGIKSAFDDFGVSNDISELKGELKGFFKKIKMRTDPKFAFSLYHMFVYNYFDYFIGSKLPMSIRNQAIQYFQEFKTL